MRVKLKVLLGSSAGKEISIPVSRFLIGRADDCHMRPKSDAISRNHCAILVSDDSVVIRDLNSRNGTYVNGERIQGDCELKAGDKIRIGKLEFEAVIKASKKTPAEEKPKKTKEKKESEKPKAAKPAKVAKAAEAAEAAETAAPEKPKSDSGSVDFDVSEWLEEADAVARARRQAEPETRQFQLDETDRIALEQAEEDSEAKKGAEKPGKKPPGKLPPKPTTTAASSRDAAADMLKKFFSNR